MDKRLIGVLACYALVSIIIFSWMDITITNSYQRANTAAYMADFAKKDLLKTNSFQELKDNFLQGHGHYKIFSGIADWPPLQLMLLTLSFLVFGINKLSFMFFPLIITLLTLIYLYKLVLLSYNNRNIALTTVILTALSTFFFYESATPMLENGIALFTIMCVYYFALYLKTKKDKYFYSTTAALALGLLYKEQMILIIPALAGIFLYKTRLKEFFTSKRNYKMLLVSLAVFFLIMLPMIAREIVLMKEGVSIIASRSIGRIKYIYEDVGKKGFLTAKELEFQNELPEYKRELINNRYSLSHLQKFIIAITSTFFNWILIPFILLGLARKYSKFNDIEIMILIFVATSLVFFSLHGLIPRLALPTAILLNIFAAKGVFSLPRKAIIPIMAIVFIMLGFQTSSFFVKIYNNEHILSMQHDYEASAQYMLDNTQGEFTVITSRVHQMAFEFIRQDKNRKAYVELIPEKQEQLKEMLQGIFRTPELLEESNIEYETTRPKVRYVVIHEKLETGPLKGLADYNIPEFLNNYENATLVKTIDSPFPNSRTWIYQIN
ncbi:MAG TPA: glycosyltransferase family 39 protein [Candidatus Nanoarchaeia archaeon]|nr:glycosyltransferase family 39 protein [Candidatus Nanoarchaeia archaeon]